MELFPTTDLVMNNWKDPSQAIGCENEEAGINPKKKEMTMAMHQK